MATTPRPARSPRLDPLPATLAAQAYVLREPMTGTRSDRPTSPNTAAREVAREHDLRKQAERIEAVLRRAAAPRRS